MASEARLQDLWGHVVGRPNHGLGCRLLCCQQLGDPKVSQLDDAIAEEKVAGLQVPVYQPLQRPTGLSQSLPALLQTPCAGAHCTRTWLNG